MAIRDALPCGDKGTDLQVRTGSVEVNDEIIPNDDSEGEVINPSFLVCQDTDFMFSGS